MESVTTSECTIKVETKISDTRVIENWYMNGIRFKSELQAFDEEFTKEDAIKNVKENTGSKKRFALFMRRSVT